MNFGPSSSARCSSWWTSFNQDLDTADRNWQYLNRKIKSPAICYASQWPNGLNSALGVQNCEFESCLWRQRMLSGKGLLMRGLFLLDLFYCMQLLNVRKSEMCKTKWLFFPTSPFVLMTVAAVAALNWEGGPRFVVVSESRSCLPLANATRRSAAVSLLSFVRTSFNNFEPGPQCTAFSWRLSNTSQPDRLC